jgi:hypothetical protein
MGGKKQQQEQEGDGGHGSGRHCCYNQKSRTLRLICTDEYYPRWSSLADKALWLILVVISKAEQVVRKYRTVRTAWSTTYLEFSRKQMGGTRTRRARACLVQSLCLTDLSRVNNGTTRALYLYSCYRSFSIGFCTCKPTREAND